MNPDHYEPTEHQYNPTEFEFTTKDGQDFYVVAVAVEERHPVVCPNTGKHKTERLVYLLAEESEIFVLEGDTYSTTPIKGEDKVEWVAKYGDQVAEIAIDKINSDDWAAREEFMYR